MGTLKRGDVVSITEVAEVVYEKRIRGKIQGRGWVSIMDTSDDYRYFPEPDIVPLYVDDEWKERVRQTIPELPDERKAKYVNELGLPEYDAHVLTLTKEMSDFFEGAIDHGADVKLTSNWLMGGVNEYLNKNQVELKIKFWIPKFTIQPVGTQNQMVNSHTRGVSQNLYPEH